MAALNAELAIGQRSLEARRKILDKITAAIQEHVAKNVEIEQRAAERTAQEWDRAFQQIIGPFNSMISGMISGTETFQQAGVRALESFAMMGIQELEKWAFKTIYAAASQAAASAFADSAEAGLPGLAAAPAAAGALDRPRLSHARRHLESTAARAAGCRPKACT
jgi:hypothetical protein